MTSEQNKTSDQPMVDGPGFSMAEMTVMRLEPGDVVVVRTPQPLSSETASRLNKMLRDFLTKKTGFEVEVIVLDGGTQLDVLRTNFNLESKEEP